MIDFSERAYFKWRHFHPNVAEDPRAAFAAGVRVGKQQMLEASTEWAQLPPLLASLLEELVSLREERETEREVAESDMRPAF